MSETLGEFFFERAQSYRDVTALWDAHANPEVRMTYAEAADQVRALGAGLLKLGTRPGDRVVLLSDNRPRWLISDMAIVSIGAVSVPRGSDSTVQEIWYILNHCEAVLAIVQDNKTLQRIAEGVLEESHLQQIILMDDSKKQDSLRGIRLLNLSEVLALGNEDPKPFDTARAQVKPSDVAAIVYTSGTTGFPKGVVLNHANLCHQADNIILGIQDPPGNIQIAILPTWHAYERACEYYAIRTGATLTYTDKRWLRDDMAKRKPAQLPCVPRIWESVYSAVFDKLRKEPKLKQRFVLMLLDGSIKYVQARRIATRHDARRRKAGFFEVLRARFKMLSLLPFHKLADLLVLSKLRAVTGGCLRFAISGGGSFPAYLDDFFEAAGVTVLNGYGLTEASPVLAYRTLGHNIRGTVGLPMPSTEIEIRDEEGRVLPQGEVGVIWGRGPQIMGGYYKNDEATRAIIDENGWLNTGDLGWIAWTGDLTIAGRAKDTIVLLGGENIEPEPIECALTRSPYITQILVVGQDQKSLGALVVPDYANLAAELKLASGTTHEDILANPSTMKLVRDEISRIMKAEKRTRSTDQITRVRFLAEPFSEANGLLTKTMKPKRNVILKHYADEIAKMFA